MFLRSQKLLRFCLLQKTHNLKVMQMHTSQRMEKSTCPEKGLIIWCLQSYASCKAALFTVVAFALAGSRGTQSEKRRSWLDGLTSSLVSVNGPSKKVETVLSERIPLPRDTKFGVFAAAWYAPAEPTAKIGHSGKKLQGRFNLIFLIFLELNKSISK